LAALLVFCGSLGISAEKEKEPGKKGPAFHAGLKAACKAAEADGSLVLLVFGSKLCNACQSLKEKTLLSPAFLEKAGPLHIVQIDPDADEKAARAFKVSTIPDLVLLTGDGKIVARRQGFVAADKLLPWIEQGRRRAAQGLWEGTAPREEPDQLVGRARSDQLTDDDLKELVQRMGAADPAARLRAARVLLAQRERAVPFLIEGTTDRYLGVRIGASGVLKKMAPNAPTADPWTPRGELQKRAAELEAWWAKTGKLPPPDASRAADPIVERSVESALKAVLSNDPVARTEGMTALVRIGQDALPKVRECIKRCERTGNQKAVWALEDVRWAILIPHSVEALAKGARRDLARGASQQRQAAASRLARGGRAAVPALRELVEDDDDPLVQESATQALSAIGGRDALFAISILLKAADSNLRMTAAQALGHTKNRDAAKYLIAVLNDPDEVVACTAIAALEEIKAKEQRDPLLRCLSDTRWRVRAAAAEAIGKLKIAGTENELTRLLNDPDPFVVRSALEALRRKKCPPGPQELEALVKRVPALSGLAADILLDKDSPSALEVIGRLYDRADDAARAAILEAMAEQRNYNNSPDNHWKPVLTKAVASASLQIRRLAAATLANRSYELAAELVTRLLDDAAHQVRSAGASVVLRVAANRWGASRRSRGNDYSIMNVLNASVQEPLSPRQARARELVKQHAAWRNMLLKRAGESPHPAVALAIYATGDGRTDLPLLLGLLDRPDLKTHFERLDGQETVGLMLRRVPWPEGRAVLEKVCQKPFLHGMALEQLKHATKEAREYLWGSDRILASLTKGDRGDLQRMASQLLGRASSSLVSLRVPSERNTTLLKALLKSKKPALRAMAIFALGHRYDDESVARVEQALKDKNPWIRRAALQGIARRITERDQLEKRLGPFLSDPDGGVAAIAAIGLLLPEVCGPTRLRSEIARFASEKIHVWGSGYTSTSRDRPLVALPSKPSFLERARKLLARTKENDPVLISALALLLAQYGDPSGLDRLAQLRAGAERISPDLLVGIGLSKDPKYIPLLRNMLPKAASQWRVRELLKAVRGMQGAEAREFRREVNKRLRELGSP